jgi:hypothetical protein
MESIDEFKTQCDQQRQPQKKVRPVTGHRGSVQIARHMKHVFGHTSYMDSPKTLQEAIIYFADYDNCRRFLIDLRWADGQGPLPPLRL